MICALFAVDDNGGMGANGELPWPHNRDDMMWFKETTEGQVVVMGRKTWESSGMPKPLPKRHNVIVTHNFLLREDVVQIRGNVIQGLRYIEHKFKDEDVDLFVIGGPDLLMQAIPVISKVFLTRIPGEYFCDTLIDIDKFLETFELVDQNDLGSCKVEVYEAISGRS